MFGLARNQRLRRIIGPQMWEATQQWNQTRQTGARVYRVRLPDEEDEDQTGEDSGWDRERRVVAKAEHIDGKENPRFVVTSLTGGGMGGASACTKTSTAHAARWRTGSKSSSVCLPIGSAARRCGPIRLRLYFSAMAYVLVCGLRRLGLKGTELETAQVATIRTRLLKIGAQVRVSVRRVYLAMAAGYPWKAVFAQAYANLCGATLA